MNMSLRYTKNSFARINRDSLRRIWANLTTYNTRIVNTTVPVDKTAVDVTITRATCFLGQHLNEPKDKAFIRRIPDKTSRYLASSALERPKYTSKDPQLMEWRILPEMSDEAIQILVMFLLKYDMLLYKRKGVWYLSDANLELVHKVELGEWYSMCGPYTYDLVKKPDEFRVLYYEGTIRHLAGSYDPLLKHGKYVGSPTG